MRFQNCFLNPPKVRRAPKSFLFGTPPQEKLDVNFYFLVVSFSEPESYYWFYGECRHALCMCDSEAVQCFKNAEFNDSFKYYSQDKC